MSTKKTSTKPAKNIKDELAKGAAAIRAAKAKSNPAKAGKGLSSATSKDKSPKSKKSPTSTSPKAKKGELIVLPKVDNCKDPIGDIMARRVELNAAGTAITILPETTIGEGIRIIDNLCVTAETSGLILGDAINQMKDLPAFQGQFAAVMASTGRSVDRLRTFASVALNTPPAIRGQHPAIEFEHLRAIVRVERLEDKKALVKEMVEAAKDGRPLTVKQVVEKASKINPPKRPGKKKDKAAKAHKAAKETRDLTFEEADALAEMEDKAGALASLIESSSFMLEAKKETTLTLREKLERIARFSAQLAE